MTPAQQRALDMLREDRRRDIYQTCYLSEYMVTYSGGKSPTLTVQEVEDLLRRGMIRLRWPDHPEAKSYMLTE